ncbi:hypothetical protein TNCV_1788351, partial [Trichonephila clavipes]
MAFLGKGKKQDMLQLAEELGINATLNMTVPSLKLQSLTVKIIGQTLNQPQIAELFDNYEDVRK